MDTDLNKNTKNNHKKIGIFTFIFSFYFIIRVVILFPLLHNINNKKDKKMIECG